MKTFYLNTQPLAVSLSVHISNYDARLGRGAFAKNFTKQRYDSIMLSLIDYYSEEYIKGFIKDFFSGAANG